MVIGDPPRGAGQRPGVGRQPGQHRGVGVVDLARAQRLPGRAKLVAGAQDRDARSGRDGDGGGAGGRRRAELAPRPAGSRPRARSCPRACPRPAPRMLSPTAVAAWVSIVAPLSVTSSCGITAVAPAGTAAPVEIRIASPSRTSQLRGRAGARLADDLEHAPGVPGEDRVAVHRRARERRHVAGGAHVGGQHAAERGVDLHLLGRQDVKRFEDELSGSRDRDQRRRHPCSPFSICAAAPPGRVIEVGDAARPTPPAARATGRRRADRRAAVAVRGPGQGVAAGAARAGAARRGAADPGRRPEHRGAAAVRGDRARARR